MIAQPMTDTVARFRKAARRKDLASMYGIMEGLAASLMYNGEVNEWALVTLIECARLGDHYRNNREEAMSGAR